LALTPAINNMRVTLSRPRTQLVDVLPKSARGFHAESVRRNNKHALLDTGCYTGGNIVGCNRKDRMLKKEIEEVAPPPNPPPEQKIVIF
jgi:hypothetical protein